MPNCPECGSQYVASKGSIEEDDGFHHRYYCEACGEEFETIEYRETAEGDWLITFENAAEYIEVYRGDNDELNVNLKEEVNYRTRYRSGKSTLSFHVFSSTLTLDGSPSFSVFVKPSIGSNALLIRSVKMNEELTELALENPAMKTIIKKQYRYDDEPDTAELYFNTIKGEAINKDICRFFVEAIGDGAKEKEPSGCYVATAVYGSYDCPQVWTLRRFRDFTLSKTWYGRAFVHTYYAISPTLVKWFGEATWFKKMWRGPLDRMVHNLNNAGVENTPYQDREW